MKVAGKCIVVTGGGRGIGRALCERFAAEGARGVVVADIDPEPAEEVARAIGGVAVPCDAADAAQMADLVQRSVEAFGPIDLFCSNAGIIGTEPGAHDLEVPQGLWDQTMGINLMAHIYAARLLVPGMVDRGSGYFLQTVSAAGLITANSGPAYTVTKHAAIGFAEWLSINYRGRGIGVSCLCPTAVATRMTGNADPKILGQILQPAEVADYVIEGLDRERFLILPEPRVGDSFLRKAQDYDRWLAGTGRRVERMRAGPPPR